MKLLTFVQPSHDKSDFSQMTGTDSHVLIGKDKTVTDPIESTLFPTLMQLLHPPPIDA